jgi:hypothetical protein
MSDYGIARATGTLLNNTTATTAPQVTDDGTKGYSAGSLWVKVNATTAAYICTSNATGAAAWLQIG